jgi:hypothetical protein
LPEFMPVAALAAVFRQLKQGEDQRSGAARYRADETEIHEENEMSHAALLITTTRRPSGSKPFG